MPPTRAATTDIVWDFSEFAEPESLNSEIGVPNYGYNGLIIQGARTSEQRDYISSSGVYFYGATKSAQRAICYTPSVEGRLIVSYKSNGSTACSCFISTTYDNTGYIAIDSNVVGSVAASLTPGKNYIIGSNAGITITNIIFDPS